MRANPHGGSSTVYQGILRLCLLAGLMLVGAAQALAQQTPVRLELFGLEGGPMRYRAERTFVESDGKTTETTIFSTPEGTPIQEVVGVFETDTLVPVSYTVNDQRSGQKETALREGDKVLMTALEKTGEKEKSGSVKYKEGMIIISSVVPFIQRNWEALAEGKELTFLLLAPVKQDYFQFRVVKDDGKGELKVKAPEGAMVIRMEADTWLIRKMVDPMYFVMDGQPPHRILEYHGRSSVKTDEGEDQALHYVNYYE